MKKILLACAAAALLFSFAACSDSSDGDGSKVSVEAVNLKNVTTLDVESSVETKEQQDAVKEALDTDTVSVISGAVEQAMESTDFSDQLKGSIGGATELARTRSLENPVSKEVAFKSLEEAIQKFVTSFIEDGSASINYSEAIKEFSPEEGITVAVPKLVLVASIKASGSETSGSLNYNITEAVTITEKADLATLTEGSESKIEFGTALANVSFYMGSSVSAKYSQKSSSMTASGEYEFAYQIAIPFAMDYEGKKIGGILVANMKYAQSMRSNGNDEGSPSESGYLSIDLYDNAGNIVKKDFIKADKMADIAAFMGDEEDDD